MSAEDTAPRTSPVRFCAAISCFLRYLLVVFPLFAVPTHSHADDKHRDDAGKTPAVVALASSFRTLWPTLVDAYVAETGNPNPLVSFASSGLLTTQILHGAPFELYLSADEATVDRLASAGKTKQKKYALAKGTLSLVWRGAGTPSLSELGPLMEENKQLKIAIANPRHAPYGIAAKQALDNAGLQPLPHGKLLTAENASQALQYALNGAADAALVPTILAQQVGDENIKILPIDQTSYQSVVHHLILLQPADNPAEALSNWLKTPQALTIMQGFGLTTL
ncbi:MAG: molybdate ABC transporter substrate-binding protein [Granulosicoccus sp.]